MLRGKLSYTFNTLIKLLEEGFIQSQHEICIGFTDTIIERNYFGKHLKDNNIFVISFYQVDKILASDNIDIFNFMITMIYRYITRYKLLGKYLTHDETRACIFDMCGNKQDIIYLCSKPTIGDECLVKMKNQGIQISYLNALQKEIRSIRKSRYYRIFDFIKQHPYISLLIGSLATILLNLISSALFECIKQWKF